MIITKSSNTKLFHPESYPNRIISLVPSLTQFLCDVELEDTLVGVTKFCVHPKHIRKVATVVGGTKTIHMDKIKALDPDFIIANKEENTKEMVEACAAICPVYVTDIKTEQDAIIEMTQLGKHLGVEGSVLQLTNKLKDAIHQLRLKSQMEPKKKAIYLIWKDPYMVSGSDTFIKRQMELAGYENVIKKTRYPEVDLNEIKKLNPEVILLSSEPFPFSKAHQDEIEKTTGIPTILVNGEHYSWYGSMMLDAYFEWI